MNAQDQSFFNGKCDLISELGYWPDFCDAKISELIFSRDAEVGIELSLTLRYIDTDLNREILVKIVFHGISNMNFNELSTENVIDKLSISDSFVIEIEAAAGLFGRCTCKAIDVDIISSTTYSVTSKAQ